MVDRKKDGIFIDAERKQEMETKKEASHIAFKWEQTKREIIED